jgi:hypothetical protein
MPAVALGDPFQVGIETEISVKLLDNPCLVRRGDKEGCGFAPPHLDLIIRHTDTGDHLRKPLIRS